MYIQQMNKSILVFTQIKLKHWNWSGKKNQGPTINNVIMERLRSLSDFPFNTEYRGIFCIQHERKKLCNKYDITNNLSVQTIWHWLQIYMKSRYLFHYFVLLILNEVPYNFSGKVDNLNCTDDWESSEEPHGASNSRQHVHKLGCFLHGDSFNCGGVKVDPHKP